MSDVIQTIDQMIRETCIKALARAGTAPGAAALMGVSVRTVERWKRRFNIYWDIEEQVYKIKPKKSKCTISIVQPIVLGTTRAKFVHTVKQPQAREKNPS